MKLKRTASLGLLCTAFLTVAAAQQNAADWPQWRGPNRDAAGSLAVPATWPDALVHRWKVEVGLGYATPLVVGNRLYQFSRQGDQEVMSALNPETGAVLWRTGYPVSFTMNSAAARHGEGPKSTPAFANGRIYSIGSTGTVTAFDAATGKQLWQKPGGAVQPMYTNHAFSPLVDRGLVVFHVGGQDQGALTAFDASTGDVKWQWTGDGPGYGSPVVADFGRTHQIVTITQGKVVGVNAANGALLWQRPFVSSNFTNAMTPNIYGQMVIVGGAGGPTQAFTVDRQNDGWTTADAWQNTDVPLRLSNALMMGDVLFGLSTRNMGMYFAVDANSGKTLWTSEPRQAAQAAIVRAGNTILSLHDDGNLVVFKSNALAYEPVKRYKVADSDTWTQPALSGNRLFIKDVSTLSLWTVN